MFVRVPTVDTDRGVICERRSRSHLCIWSVRLAGGVDWAGTFTLLVRLVQGGRRARSKFAVRVSNCASVARRSLEWSLGGSFRGSPS
eukprot:4498698-Pyramimonas_sp.AAC.1